MTRSARLAVIIGVAIAGFVFLVCAGVATFIYFKLRDEFAPPQNIRITIISPDEVNQGEAFTIEIRVANDAAETQTIESIDVYDTYLAGVLLNSSDPPWGSSSHIVEFITYDYDLAIPPGGEQVVKFEATAIQAGDFQGDFDVCVNSDTSFVTEVVRTIVEQPGAAD